MEGPDGRASTRTSRIIRADRQAIYRAFIDPAALLDWLPPGEMTGEFHAFDARVGGGYEMSLFYPPGEQPGRGKTEDREDRVRVRFVALEPPDRIVEATSFVSNDPALAGEMRMIATFRDAMGGTEVTMTFEDLPPGLKPADNDEGARLSLEQLARLVEETGRPD
jgi:uncharacterized protein YndB with AHSA1/START domain